LASYISSNANRFYAAIETIYGQAAPVNAGNRFPAARLQGEQLLESSKRVDKTGARSFTGIPPNSRRYTAFEVRTYLTSWTGPGEPFYGPLLQSALGSPSQLSSGLIVAAVQTPTQIQTTAPHGLSMGLAVSYLSEVRFVTAVPDLSTIVINAPWSNGVEVNASLGPTTTYQLSSALPSITLYDFWDPVTAVSRMITGAAVDTFQVFVEGDYHEFIFSGPAADLLDSSSFARGSAGLSSFPTEPALGNFDYSIMSGHLGQVWLGSTAAQFFTLTQANIEVQNNIKVRNHEYGSSYPRASAPGARHVACEFTLLARNDTQTTALYAAAKQREPISAMLQLGQKQRGLMGIFVPKVTPEIPNYDDSEMRLQWQFKNNLAQGSADDEIYVAFA
jgi:hypothetical protein